MTILPFCEATVLMSNIFSFWRRTAKSGIGLICFGSFLVGELCDQLAIKERIILQMCAGFAIFAIKIRIRWSLLIWGMRVLYSRPNHIVKILLARINRKGRRERRAFVFLCGLRVLCGSILVAAPFYKLRWQQVYHAHRAKRIHTTSQESKRCLQVGNWNRPALLQTTFRPKNTASRDQFTKVNETDKRRDHLGFFWLSVESEHKPWIAEPPSHISFHRFH